MGGREGVLQSQHSRGRGRRVKSLRFKVILNYLSSWRSARDARDPVSKGVGGEKRENNSITSGLRNMGRF